MSANSNRRLRTIQSCRAAVIVVLLCAASAAGVVSTAAKEVAAEETAKVAVEPVYTFVSSPELFNADLGDVSGLP
jgi:flagellar basal body-associated protein FliL